jgi:hypothetical protein
MKPCPKCPFRKDIEPGALGGSPTETYIGQIHGPFMLPCHMHCNFDDPFWKDKVIETPQCIGAAIFRTHVNVVPLPKPIIVLPASDIVFKDEAEFIAHHDKCSRRVAEAFLQAYPPKRLLIHQLMKPEVRTYKP